MSNQNRFVPTEDSLSFSETIAKALDMPFDKTATKNYAYDLLERYFNDIAQVLPDETRDCYFENFASRNFMAFADQVKDMPVISIDEQWQMFLMSANILVCVRACIVLNKEEQRANTMLFRENLDTFSDPYMHETLREKMRPVFIKHAQVLPLANLLTTCMFGFMLCHELAHHNLDHMDKIQNKQHELDADTKGFEYLTRVSTQFENLKFLKIPLNMLCAPVLAMTYLRALEMIGIISKDSNSHPSASQRTKNLYEQFNTVANDNAHYLYNGLSLSTEELIAELGAKI
ncbi:MAG TPA: hypothetical protein PKJ85_08590 [Nitrosomonas nitrosa]|nr:hypothetical protein [Nitrosomonas nitrosa]